MGSVPLLLDRSLRQTVSPSLSLSAGQSLSKSQLPPQWKSATQLPDGSATQSTRRLPVSTALSTRLLLSMQPLSMPTLMAMLPVPSALSLSMQPLSIPILMAMLPVSSALSLSLPRLTPMSTMDTAREPLMPMELASPSAVVTTKQGSVPPFSSPSVPEQFHCHYHSQKL